MKCRHCQNNIEHKLIDLGAQPPSNSYLSEADLNKNEVYLPLRVYVCSNCFLVQTADFTDRETFFNSQYAYFSSTSKTWLAHAKEYVEKVTKEHKEIYNSMLEYQRKQKIRDLDRLTKIHKRQKDEIVQELVKIAEEQENFDDK